MRDGASSYVDGLALRRHVVRRVGVTGAAAGGGGALTTRCAASPRCDRRRAAEAAARNRAATSASGLILVGGVASGRGDLYWGASMSPLSDMETTVTAEDIVT